MALCLGRKGAKGTLVHVSWARLSPIFHYPSVSLAFDHCIVRVADSNITFPSNICGFHGTCVSFHNGFMCTCHGGYSGLLCQHGKCLP